MGDLAAKKESRHWMTAFAANLDYSAFYLFFFFLAFFFLVFFFVFRLVTFFLAFFLVFFLVTFFLVFFFVFFFATFFLAFLFFAILVPPWKIFSPADSFTKLCSCACFD